MSKPCARPMMALNSLTPDWLCPGPAGRAPGAGACERRANFSGLAGRGSRTWRRGLRPRPFPAPRSLRYRPAPQGRLAQGDEVLQREACDPPLLSQMALNRLIVSAVALALNCWLRPVRCRRVCRAARSIKEAAPLGYFADLRPVQLLQ